jgi:nucleoside-diphosphate-sugar epimerase
MSDHFLITGAMGCIGAWVVRNLVQEGTQVTVFDLSDNPHRLRLIMTPEELARVRFVRDDITELAPVERAFQEGAVTHVIHLAALQVPFCKADPVMGAKVNVVGTVNVFEAARRLGLKRVVYASSVAVYGLSDEYPEDVIGNDAPLRPRNLYGVYKQANEGTARIYWQDHGLSSLGLRGYTIYGPGRDQGMTSSPTKAMLAAAAGQPYHITYGGRSGMQYVDDVAKIFIQAARVSFEGAEVFNMRGSVVDMTEVIAAIEAAEPAVRGRLTHDPKPLPFPSGTDDAALRAVFGQVPDTPLAAGVGETIALFKGALAEGKIKAE